jgi:hypothetical protein
VVQSFKEAVVVSTKAMDPNSVDMNTESMENKLPPSTMVTGSGDEVAASTTIESTVDVVAMATSIHSGEKPKTRVPLEVSEREIKQLHELLWPDERRMAIFKGLCGGESPDIRRILQSRTFRKALKAFEKSGKTELDMHQLFALAATAHQKFKIIVDVVETVIIGEDTTESSVETEQGDGPSSNKRLKSGSEKHFEFVSKPNESYVAKVKAKAPQPLREKQHSEYLLHVYEGREFRDRISEEVFQKVMEAYHLRCLEGIAQNQAPPSVEWIGFADQVGHKEGAGLIAASNKESLEWAKNIIASINLEGTSFRAWDKSERMYTCVTLRLPKSLKNCDLFPDEVIRKALFFQNRGLLPMEGSKTRSLGSTIGKDGFRAFRLLVDEEVRKDLEETNGKLQLLGTGVDMFCGNEPLVKKKSN